MIWNNTEYGFTGFNDRAHASCNIEQNRIIIYPNSPVDVLYNGQPMDKIQIELESPMPLYNEVQLLGILEGFTIFTINMTGNYDYDIRQLQSAIENFIAGNIPT